MKKAAKIYPVQDRPLSVFRNSPLSLFFSHTTSVTPDLPEKYDLLATDDNHLQPHISPTSVTIHSPTSSFGLLIKDEEDQWRIEIEDNHYSFPFDGPYDFVKVMSGEIYVRHGVDQELVKENTVYAGKLYFSDDGLATLLKWNNQTDDNLTLLIDAEDVGLPMETFQDIKTCSLRK